MDNDDLYFGGTSPVTVNATNCHTVNVNVQLVVHERPANTLQRWADDIEIMQRAMGGPHSESSK